MTLRERGGAEPAPGGAGRVCSSTAGDEGVSAERGGDGSTADDDRGSAESVCRSTAAGDEGVSAGLSGSLATAGAGTGSEGLGADGLGGEATGRSAADDGLAGVPVNSKGNGAEPAANDGADAPASPGSEARSGRRSGSLRMLEGASGFGKRSATSSRA